MYLILGFRAGLAHRGRQRVQLYWRDASQPKMDWQPLEKSMPPGLWRELRKVLERGSHTPLTEIRPRPDAPGAPDAPPHAPTRAAA